MAHHISPTGLYSIDEAQDLMVDACLCDAQRQLVFLSLWGRDTATQAFLGRLTVGAEEDGLTGFHLQTSPEDSMPVEIGNIDRLGKRTTRALRGTLFGTLNHLWLFDRRCVQPDKTNARALAVIPRDTPNKAERLWRLVTETCPLPLLDHWRDGVLQLLKDRSMLTELPFSVGPLMGFQLSLDVSALTQDLGNLIRAGLLDVEQPATTRSISCLPLKRAA